MWKFIILRVLLFNVVLVEFLNGFLSFNFKFIYFGKIIYSLIIAILTIALLSFRQKKRGLALVVLSLFVLLVFLRHFTQFTDIYIDINAFIRSGFMMYLIYEFMVNFKLHHKKYLIEFIRSQYFLFYFISVSILLHKYFGLGGTFRFNSDVIRENYFSFFDSGNTLIALYLVTFVSTFYISKNRLETSFNFILAFIIVLLTGSKVGILGVICLIIFKEIHTIRSRNKFLGNTLVLSVITGAGVILFNLNLVFNFIIKFLINYSSEGAKIEQSKFEIVDILFSRRNIQLENSLVILRENTFFESLNGIGLENVKLALGKLSQYEETTMVESDLVDIWLSFGLVGLIFFFYPYFVQLRVLSKNVQNISLPNNPQLSLLLMLGCMFLVSLLSGHVFLNTPTCIVLGVLLSFSNGVNLSR